MSGPRLTSHRRTEGSLWMLTIAPAIWAMHLLLCYVTAAVWCAKIAAPGGALGGVRIAIGCYTAVALVAIAAVGWEGLRRHGPGTETTTHDLDTDEDCRRFLGFATLLLSGLSAVAVVYAALAATLFDTCR